MGAEAPRRLPPALLATLGLLAVTAAWGSTFFLLKDTLQRLPVADFLALRFLVAAVALWLLRPRSVAALPPAVRRRGVVLGLVYGAAQLLQTAGLQYTSASVSGFVTGMYVVLTPLLGALLLRERLPRSVLGAVALATVGLGVLSLRGFAVGPGELLTLASAALYAAHILGLGAWTSVRDAFGLSVVQMATICAVCSVGALPGGIEVPQRADDWLALLHMALVAGAFALVVQTWAQAHLAATRAAIIMTMEPVWATGFAVAFGGETLTGRALVGGGLVLTAMYLAELGPRGGRDAPPTPELVAEDPLPR